MDWKDSVRLAPSDIAKKQFVSVKIQNAKIVSLLLRGLSIALDMKKK